MEFAILQSRIQVVDTGPAHLRYWVTTWYSVAPEILILLVAWYSFFDRSCVSGGRRLQRCRP